MGAMRNFIRDHRRMAAFLAVAALFMKLLVPAGFMPGGNSHAFTIEICGGDASGAQLAKLAIPLQGKSGDAEANHDKSTMDCPYASLSLTALGGTDLVLLVLAIAFVLALGFAAVYRPPVERIRRALPPLRGPPCPA